MRTATVLALATLALGAMLWAADDAVVAPQPSANLKSRIENPKSADPVAIPHEKVQPPFSSAESGGSPHVLSYQGRLTDANGVPVHDGSYSVRFSLYAAPTGGSPFWNETQCVTTRDGLFSVLLGAVTAITTGDGRPGTGAEAAYLGMAVEGSEEMTPRLRIAGTYALPGERVAANDDKGGGTDNDDEWVRSSPADSVLYTIRRLGIARGGCGNVLYGNWTCSMTNLGSACTTGISGSGGASLGNMAVLGGYGNRVWAPYTSVGGGRNNKAGNDAADTSAIVVGGYDNKATAKFAYVAGGLSNTASGVCASIGGGQNNAASGNYATSGGGATNTVSGNSAAVGGGANNSASSGGATVGGGVGNSASGAYAMVGGGQYDTATAGFSGALSGLKNLAGDAAGDTGAVVAGGEYNRAIGMWSSVAGGGGNTASGNYAAAGGGAANTASGNSAVVGGGTTNSASASAATVAGGSHNTANGTYTMVGGGYGNTASNDCAMVGGGLNDTAQAYCGGVFSGKRNLAGDAAGDTGAVVAGGGYNRAIGMWSCVGGGVGNVASGNCAAVGGGANSTAGDHATVSGGWGNIASGQCATVGGGFNDTALASCAGVLSGKYNVAGDAAGDTGAVVAGGGYNKATGIWASVGGGVGNVASGNCATVGGGANGTAGDHATVGGGWGNTASGQCAAVGGGFNNSASGQFAVIPGGDGCQATGRYSLAAGCFAQANHTGSFVWADSGSSFASGARNQFLVRAKGGSEFWGNVRVKDTLGNLLLEFGQGLDYAEGFHVSDAAQAAPGTVLTIDPVNAGQLRVSSVAYDRRVAGIVAGANDLGSGVKLGGQQFDHNVALAGRVYCNVEATTEGIEPGVLTTSATPGYAMKAVDRARAPGAILGKAMERLPRGSRGLVLVLVTLQ